MAVKIILEKRFGPTPEEILIRLNTIDDLEKLSQLLIEAAILPNF